MNSRAPGSSRHTNGTFTNPNDVFGFEEIARNFVFDSTCVAPSLVTESIHLYSFVDLQGSANVAERHSALLQ